MKKKTKKKKAVKKKIPKLFNMPFYEPKGVNFGHPVYTMTYDLAFEPFGSKVLLPNEKKKKLEIKTQKAKGILLCLNRILDKYPHLVPFFARVEHKLIRSEIDIKNNTYLPCFARPCPTKPRHGFVDSRVIKDNKALLKLWKEMLKHDPKGEIILGPYLPKVDYNAVYVDSGMLSIGIGNDGATAGKGSINFPVAPHNFTKTMRRKAGIGKNEAIYIEAIRPKEWYRWAITQMRGGPVINAVSPDYVNKKVIVKNIVNPSNDLLEWEAQTRAFAPGTVVYAPGHTLASHAAIHCVINKIPFITSHEPKVGEVLSSTQRKKRKPMFRRKQFKRGVRAGINMCRDAVYDDMVKLFYFSISVLHNWAYIKHSEHADWLLGSAAVILAKLCAALALGEYRHKNGNSRSLRRENVYVDALNDPTKALYKLPKVFKDFYSIRWESGFGGLPWANCTWYSHLLWKSITKMFNHKNITISDNEVSELVMIVNRTINLAHNNGWWFNKFTTKEDMDFIAKSPGLGILCVTDILMDVYKAVGRVNGVKKKLKKTNRAFSPCGKDGNGNLVWVKVYGVRSKNVTIAAKTEDGRKKTKEIKLTQEEFLALRRKYRREKKAYNNTAVLTVRAGKFRIPGSKESKPLRKVFNI
ncbi:MAG: hypothetical protein ACXAC5_04670 [Promethearchaeota archaeon]|jgi:hypothetical protein